MSKLSQKAELAANILIIVVAVLRKVRRRFSDQHRGKQSVSERTWTD